jgi:hypothetical protein
MTSARWLKSARLGSRLVATLAAGTPFVLLQAMLGILPDAPRGRLYKQLKGLLRRCSPSVMRAT